MYSTGLTGVSVQHWASLLLLCKAWDRLAELGAQLSKRASLLMTSGADGPIGIVLRPLPIEITGPLLKRNPPPPLDRAKYPNVCSWTETDWKTWRATTPEGEKASQYTSFLEDKDGNHLPARG